LNTKLKGFELKETLPENKRIGRTKKAGKALERESGEVVEKPPSVPRRIDLVRA